MPDIVHIVFDVGRVLLHWDPEIPFRHLIPDQTERNWFLENICSAEWNIEQDRGRTWADAETHLIDQHPQHEPMIRAYRHHWHEMVPHQIDGTAEIMVELIERGHDVTMLTNFSQETFPEAAEKFAFLQRPRGVTVSGDVKMLKPERGIYDHHADTFDLVAEQCLFFDDSPKNVEGARAAGWNAEIFTDAGKLRLDLARWGIAV